MFTSETLFIRLLWRTHPSRRCLPSNLHSPVCAPLLPIPPFTHRLRNVLLGIPTLLAALPRTLCPTNALSHRSFCRRPGCSEPVHPAICIAIAATAISTIVGVDCVDEVVVNPKPPPPPPLSCGAQLNTRCCSQMALSTLSTACLLFCHDSAVVCIQETHAPAFAALPNDQPYRCDGPCDSGGSEAGFLFHKAVAATSIPNLPDTLRTRWRLMSGRICVCWHGRSMPHPLLGRIGGVCQAHSTDTPCHSHCSLRRR